MGRKKKSILDLKQSSFRVQKSRLNVKPLVQINSNSYRSEYVENFKQEIDINTNTMNLDLEITDVHCESMNVETNSVPEIKNDKIEEINVGNFVGKVLRKHSVKFNLGRKCVSSMLKDFKSQFSELPSDYRSLLKTPRCTEIRAVDPGEYTHLGIFENLRSCVGTNETEVKLDIFIDGFAIHRDCVRKSNWIILGRYDKYIFPIGIYNGESQPKDFNSFLLDFCVESKKLIRDGINGLPFSINNILMDSPAKSHVTYTKHHTGYGSCYYCEIHGFYDGSRVCFLETDCILRTNEDFENKIDPKFHNGTSVLESLGVQMVDQIPIDYLHCVLLGVVKKILIKLFIHKFSLLSSTVMEKVSQLLLFSNNFLPSEIHRKFRGLKDLKSYHGNELRVFLLKIGFVILKNNVPNDIYNNFLLLHVSITVLTDPILSLSKYKFADHCLKLFIRDAIEIFGTEIATSVLHDLQHLPDMVHKYQMPLDAFSTFPFESYLLKIKDMVHSNNHPLPQIHRRVFEMLAFEREEYQEYQEMQKNKFRFVYTKSLITSVFMNGYKLSTAGSRDRFVLCKKKRLNVIIGIKKDKNSEPILKVRQLKLSRNFYSVPIDSEKLDIFECDTSYESFALHTLYHCDIYCKMLAVPYSSHSMSTYTVAATTEFEENYLIVVPDDWVFDDDAEICCFYPKSITKITKYIKDAVEPNNDEFIVHKITVLKESIESYELAILAKNRRKNFRDTESEVEYNKDRKVNRRESKKKRKSSDDFLYDLNSHFDNFQIPDKKIKIEKVDKSIESQQPTQKSSSKGNKKKSKNISESTELTQKSEKMKIPSQSSSIVDRKSETQKLECLGNKQKSKNISESTELTQKSEKMKIPSQSSSIVDRKSETQRWESIADINKYIESKGGSQVVEIPEIQQIEEQLSDNNPIQKNCTCRCEEYFSKLDEKLNLLLNAIRDGASYSRSSPQNVIGTTPVKPIGNAKSFHELETLLLIYYKNPDLSSPDFKIKRNNMVSYFSQKLNPNAKGAAKNSLMKSLISLYFEKEFIASLGWSSYLGRLQLEGQNGHLSLFFDIINKCLPDTYQAVKDAGTALKTIIRRNHEIINKGKRKINEDHISSKSNESSDDC